MIRTALLCVPQMDDEALDAVRALLRRVAGVVVLEERTVSSQRTWIAETLRTWCDEAEMDLVLTLGGTLPAPGPSAAEIVPEATLDVLDRLVPALPEVMRAEAQAHSPLALLDRGVAGIRSRTLIINLPEGAAAALWLEAIVAIIPAYVAHLQGDDAAPRLGDLAADDVVPDDLAADAEGAASVPRAAKALDADEFAAFLRRNKG
jgi:molybdopterin biosynthesis enzyme MoaB